LKKIYRGWEYEGGESYIRKGWNGRESLRRLKPTVGCNASKRRRRICIILFQNFKFISTQDIIGQSYHQISPAFI
jgi:hypothetical protein